jgi:hypothetical protein
MAARRHLEKDTILQWEDLVPSGFSNSVQNDSNLEPDADALRMHPKQRHA